MNIETNPKALPQAASSAKQPRVACIWGAVFKRDYVEEIRKHIPKDAKDDDELKHTGIPIHGAAPALRTTEKRFEAKGTVKLLTFPDGRQFEDVPSGIFTFDMGGEPKGKSNSKSIGQAGSSKSTDDGKKVPIKMPRVSVSKNVVWSIIGQNGRPQPNESDGQDGVKPYLIGPAQTSEPHSCNPETDIFIFDRSVLSGVQRPKGTDRGQGQEVNVFQAHDTKRAQDGRSVIQEFLLRPKNVALNINDPGSILIYLDLLIRASRHAQNRFEDHLKGRTITFFSSPIRCNHPDCGEWREFYNGHMRIPGAPNILKHPWWELASFCLRDLNSISLMSEAHEKDQVKYTGIADHKQELARTWLHAIMNHNPVATGVAGVTTTKFAIVLGEDQIPLLVDNANCLNATRLQEGMHCARVAYDIDPEILPCSYCNLPGFAMGHYRDKGTEKEKWDETQGITQHNNHNCNGEDGSEIASKEYDNQKGGGVSKENDTNGNKDGEAGNGTKASSKEDGKESGTMGWL
ncbi:hypothetical protein F4804DRAFT_348382 [Jackrogersella minutella]|nr:hypothetical protein F4804DRAFT_348382 [Jackrogersella minutella]